MVSFTSLKQLVKGQLDQELSSLDTEVAECGHLAEALGTFACVFLAVLPKLQIVHLLTFIGYGHLSK